MRRDGRLTPVREDSSISSSVRYRLPRNKKQPAAEAPGDVGPAATSQVTRTGVSNDHVTLPAIKPANQQSNQRHGLSPNTNSSQVQQYVVASNTPAAPGSLGPKQPDDTLFPAGRQHKTAAGPGMEHHMLASHLLHATNTQSRASTSSRRASSSSHASSRPRTQQQRDEAEEGTIHAQQQLQQLYGNSSTCSPEREAAAGGRILALPFAICTAADGSLYEVATGHVQLMMLRRQLAAAGIDLTDEEAALLTSGANAGSGRPLVPSPHVAEGATQTAGSSSSGADAALPAHENGIGPSLGGSEADGGAATGVSRMRKSVLSEGARGSSQAGDGGGQAAGRRVSLVGMVPARQRSALGAALEAHAGGDSLAVDPKEQLPLDDVVLSHLAQLDAFAANLRQRLADQAAAARAAKAQAVAAAAELAAGRNHSSGRRSWHVTPRSQYLQQQQQQAAAAQGEGAEADGTQAVQKPRSAARQWGAARGLVMLNIANWQKQRVRSSRMQAAPAKAPTWEDVILLGDVYIKRRSGQGAAVYEARCVELGVAACTQVLQQLECEHANMAHCNLGAGAAPALGAALSANRSISSLDLRDNNLDGRAVSHILKGIVTATATHLPASTKQRNISFSHRSVAAISANRQAEGLPAARHSAPAREEQWLLQGGTPALLVGLSGGGSSGANQQQQQQQQQQSSVAGSSIKKSKSLAVRWGEDSSSCDGAEGLSSGVDAAAAAAATAAAGGRGGSSLGGSRTVPSSPSKASAAAAAAVRLPYAWDENGEDCVPSDPQPQQQQSVSGFGGSVSAAGSLQGQQGQISCSVKSVAGSMLSSNYPVRDAADAEFFLPGTTAAHTWASQAASSSSSSGGSSFGRGSGSGSAGEAPPLPVASASGSGSASSRLVSWDSPAAGAAAAARDIDAEEASYCGADTAGGCRQQQQQQQGSVAGCGSGCEPAIYSLLSGLELSENPLGLAGGKAVAQLLDPSVHPSQFLVRLHLSKCNLGEAGGLAIAAALQAGNLELRVLLLSHNNLGNKTAVAFGDLLESSHTLKELDLSWNQIKADGGRALAKGLAANATLAKLSLAWNGLEEGACAMGDMLAANMGLKHFDLSQCRVGAEACMMLGEGLKGNVMLEVLLLSGNDRIGEDGARHLMVALAANRSLHYLGLNGSNMTPAMHEVGGGASEFNPAAPDGSYSLDLAVAADRVVAVQLVELDRAAEKELLRGISVDGKVIPSARKANWPAMLPSRGLLSCTFSSTSVRKALGVMEGSKLTTLLKQLRLSSMSDRERLEMVAVFAPFALFTCKQISNVTQTFTIGAERTASVALLFTRAADAATDLHSLTSKMSSYDRVGWREVLGWYSTYRWNAPTGHYELDLGLPVHAAIAARLRDESSDSPEGPTWLNLLYDCATTCMKKPQSHGPPDGWKAGIPTRGSVSLDYVSTHPPGSKQTHTTWGLPPLPAAGSGTGARSRRSSLSGTARLSANGAAAKAAAASTRTSAVGAAAAGGQQQGPASGSGASASASAASAAEEPLKPISDQQLEELMRKQMGLLGAAAAAPLPPPAATDAGTMAVAAAAGVAAADAAVTALRQAVASGLLLLSAQVRRLVEALTLSPHRVEVAVLCWPVTLDRDANYWTVLYALQGIEQSNLLLRLGPSRLFNPAHTSCHWVLDLAHPAHEEVAKKLVALASSSGSSSSSKAKDKGDEGTLQNWWNLRLRGMQKQVNENGNNMWGMLTAEDFQPILEFDFLGPDSWAAGGRSEAEVAAMGAADKMDLRARQAARLEAVRLKQLYPYSCDGSGFPRQPWATYKSLMSPQLLKTPWTAAWDRLVRVLLRLEHRSGTSSKHSSLLQQVFEAAAASEQMCVVVPQRPAAAAAAATAAQAAAPAEGTAAAAVAGGGSKEGSRLTSAVAQQEAAAMAEGPAAVAAVAAAAVVPGSSEAEGQEPQLCITAREFEVLLKSWGYNKAEASHYLGLMEALLQAEQDTQQAAAKAAAANAAAAAAGAEDSSLSAAAPATARDSSSGGSSAQPSRSSTSTQQAAASSGAAGKAPPAAAKGKAGFAAGGAAVKAGVRVQALAGGKAKPAGSTLTAAAAVGRLGSSADGGAASFAAQLEARFERGLTFSEFVGVVMTEPRASVRLRDVARLATLLQGGAAVAKGLKLATAAAAESGAGKAADGTDVQAAPGKSEEE